MFLAWLYIEMQVHGPRAVVQIPERCFLPAPDCLGLFGLGFLSLAQKHHRQDKLEFLD